MGLGFFKKMKVRFAFSKADEKLAYWCVAADRASINSRDFFSDANGWFGPRAESCSGSYIRDLAFQKELLACSGDDEAVRAFAKHERAETEARIQEAIREYHDLDNSRIAQDYQNAGKELTEIDNGKYDELLREKAVTKKGIELDRAYYQSLLSCSTDDDVIAAFRANQEAVCELWLQRDIAEFEKRPSESRIARAYRDAGKELQWLERNRSSIAEMIDHIKCDDAFVYKNCLVDPKEFGFFRYGEKKSVFKTKDDVDKLYTSQDEYEQLGRRVDDICLRDDDVPIYLFEHKKALLDARSVYVPNDFDVAKVKAFEELVLPQFDTPCA